LSVSLGRLAAAEPAHPWAAVIESPMYRSPDLPKPRVVKVVPERMKALWLEVLQRPEVDYQCKAALTIGLAHQRGLKGLERTVPLLVRTLERPDQHLSVRLAVARTLVELDAREAARRLLRHAQSGDSDLRAIIEPALARWDHRPARADWLERLAHPDSESASLVLAIRGLGEVHEERAVPGLRELALAGRTPAPVRLEAARALSVIRTSGSENDARRLLAGAAPHNVVTRLVAASLLRHHKSHEALRLLVDLARDDDPVVAAVALAHLVELDPKLVVPALGQLLRNPDAKVRLLAAEVLFRQPSVEHVGLLADRLGDPHPEVRVNAREWLRELGAGPRYHEPVIRQGMRVVAAPGWRGQEQAMILLTQLDHKPVAGRLVELLQANRAEVFVAAAWCLRKLAVRDTLPAVLAYFELRPRAGRHDVPGEAIDQQFCQLAQFLGQGRHRPAETALRHFIPRAAAQSGQETRTASIWALGLIHEGKAVPELVQAFEGRLKDVNTPGGDEDYRVRWMSAVALGRMKAKDALGTLRRFYSARKPSLDPVNNACGWAIEQLTGEAMPPAGTVEVIPGGWFLRPVGQ
jgi:HEAT repeat protein